MLVRPGNGSRRKGRPRADGDGDVGSHMLLVTRIDITGHGLARRGER